MTLARHARRYPATGPVAMEETHISFGGEVTRFFQARPARKLRLADQKCLFRRDPDFADAPETAQDGGFRHHFATACVFADFRPSTCRPRPKAPIAHEYWLRNVAALVCCFAPQGHLLGHETGTYGQLRVRAVVTAKIFYIQISTERAHLVFWPARTNIEGGGSGRSTHIYACWRLRLRIPLCTCDSFCWLLVLWGASRSARKKASCAQPQWRKLRVWRVAAGRIFSRLFRCVFCGL